jgi:hypothetical protein
MPQHSKTIEQILKMIESAEGPEQLDLMDLKKLAAEARKPKKRGNPNPSNAWIKEALISKMAGSGGTEIEITLADFGVILNEAIEMAKKTQKLPAIPGVRRSLEREGFYFYRKTDSQGKISGYKLVKSDRPPEDWPYQRRTPAPAPDLKKDATGDLPEAPF